eukprot:TRINITY_DN3766_c0_g1_i2.p1 TRINITY_DN3766_c0_g1~~TRINITY_DN3766_c0_g1_i2.p1  ORF type:complete len:299 (-),score=29.20 TRINITY_DN3766_c0_g1_i2:37-933(-)
MEFDDDDDDNLRPGGGSLAATLHLRRPNLEVLSQQHFLFIDRAEQPRNLDGPIQEAHLRVVDRLELLRRHFVCFGPRRTVAVSVLLHHHGHPCVLMIAPPSRSSLHLPSACVRPGETPAMAVRRALCSLFGAPRRASAEDDAEAATSGTDEAGAPKPAEADAPSPGPSASMALDEEANKSADKKPERGADDAAVADEEDPGGMRFNVGPSLGVWHRPALQPLLYPTRPPQTADVLETVTVFHAALPAARSAAAVAVPRGFTLLCVPFFELYDNYRRYGTIPATLPMLYSRFYLNCVDE